MTETEPPDTLLLVELPLAVKATSLLGNDTASSSICSSEEPPPDESRKENRLVTEPAVNAVFDVTMTVKVYDFRTPPEDDSAQAKKKKKGAR